MVTSLASAVHVKLASGERIELDPQRLYQRLLVTGISCYSHMLMRTGDKTEIMHYLIKRVSECIISTTPSNEMQFIIDGPRTPFILISAGCIPSMLSIHTVKQ